MAVFDWQSLTASEVDRKKTLYEGAVEPSQTRDAADGDLARDLLPSFRHSQSKEHEQRGRRTTRGRCQDAHGLSRLCLSDKRSN